MSRQQAGARRENRPGACRVRRRPRISTPRPMKARCPPDPCTLPTVGRFPWRTLGLDNLSTPRANRSGTSCRPAGPAPTVQLDCRSTSDSTGPARRVDGVRTRVALIIAPGPRLNVSRPSPIALHGTSRGPSTGTPDARNYLECDNATCLLTQASRRPRRAARSTTRWCASRWPTSCPASKPRSPSASSARSSRSSRRVYADPRVGIGISATNPVFPFAAPFDNPEPARDYFDPSSDYRGAAARYQGLLPFNQTQGCTPNAGDPRCTTTLRRGRPPAPFESGGTGLFASSWTMQSQSCCAWRFRRRFLMCGASSTGDRADGDGDA